ncbi:MAG: hypothetical protein ABI230_12240 [Aestuariivirga sp.]
MNCEACKRALAVGQGRVDSINAVTGSPCACETSKVSQYSPGPVQNDEKMYFLASLPNSRMGSGHINPQYLAQLEKDGLSVLREHAADNEFAITLRMLAKHWKDKGKTFEGVISFHARQIRDAKEPRLCCIYDTGEPDRPHHAELMATKIAVCYPNLKENQLKEARKARIMEVMKLIGNGFTSAQEFRQGKFFELDTEVRPVA